MVDAHVTQARSRMEMVLEVVVDRDRQGEAPFGDVLEVVDSMRESGLTKYDTCITVLRLVRAGRLWFALDGIRLMAQ